MFDIRRFEQRIQVLFTDGHVRGTTDLGSDIPCSAQALGWLTSRPCSSNRVPATVGLTEVAPPRYAPFVRAAAFLSFSRRL
jgi:prepilin-type processing-associated H-X9-DG protein